MTRFVRNIELFEQVAKQAHELIHVKNINQFVDQFEEFLIWSDVIFVDYIVENSYEIY